MTERITYDVQCMGLCIIPYIEQFNYDPEYPIKNDKPGYIRPTGEFEEWFKYITKIMFFSNPKQIGGVNLTDCLSHKDSDGVLLKDKNAQVIFEYDTIFFEFPDEEMALYFKLKFIKE